MSDLTSILNEVKRLREAVETLPGRINVSAAQVVVVTGLSDITEKLGLVQAGEFRVGNRLIPGDGFSGVRIGYPPFTYGTRTYHIAGVDADTLMFGLSATDGSAVFGGGFGLIDGEGLRLQSDTAVGGGGNNESRIRWYQSVLTDIADSDPVGQIAVAFDTAELRMTLFTNPTTAPSPDLTSTGVISVIRLAAQHADGDIADIRIDSTAGMYLESGRFGLTGSGGNSLVTLDTDGDVTLVSSNSSVIRIAPSDTGSVSENLNHIAPVRSGQVLVLMPNEGTVDVVAIDNGSTTESGFLLLANNFTMDTILDRLVLLGNDDGVDQYWVELSRSDNA